MECLCDTVKKQKCILFPSINRQLKKDPQLIKKAFIPQNIWKLLEWLQLCLISCCELPERENQNCSICKKWQHRTYFFFCYINCILNNGNFLMLNINHALHVIAYFCIVHINNTSYPEKKNKGKFLWRTKLPHPHFIFEPVPVCQIIALILNHQYPLQLSIVFFIWH